MAQTPVPNESTPSNGVTPDKSAEPLAPEQLPAERSRFTRWLARFGLGEAVAPLLRPTRARTPTPRPPA
jgi:hypothetical protein